MDVAMVLLLGLVGQSPGQSQPAVQATFHPQKNVRQNGEPIEMAVILKNVSGRPIVLLKCMERDHAFVNLSRYDDYLVVNYYPPFDAQ